MIPPRGHTVQCFVFFLLLGGILDCELKMSFKENGIARVDMDVLKALVDSPSSEKAVKVEERVGGEAWYGSMSIIPSLPSGKKRRGSPLKQVVIALLANIGTINTGMMFGFSAVTIPQLKHPASFIQITNDEASWIASLSSVSTPFGCILSGYMLDLMGRKRTIVVTLVPMIIGWFFISAASSVYMIYAGRLFVGLGAGMMGSPAMVYTGEITQPHLRGMLAACAAVGTSSGVLLQYVVGSFLSWYWLAFIDGVIITIGFISAFFLPESPTWLLNRGHTEAARSALTRLRAQSCDVDTELKDLISFSTESIKDTDESSKSDIIQTILQPSARKPFVILAFFFVIYQFCGISPVTFYAVQVIQESGAEVDKYLATMVLGIVRLLSTIVACILLRRCGRRSLTFFSTIVCGLAMWGLGTYMYMVQTWKAEGSTPVATWFPPIILYVFMAAATAGLSVLPWVMIGELYPSTVRGIMGGMTTFVGHFSMFVAIKTFPLLQSVSKFGTFLVYGSVSLVGTVYLYAYLPETKGRTLQEIEDFFSGRTSTLKPPKEGATKNNKL